MNTRIIALGIVLAGLALPPLVSAQQRLAEVNSETPEGQLLQQIGQEEDAAKKLALLEQFVKQYPKHEGTGWVYSQIQARYLKANEPDKALAAGEALCALDPKDLDAAHTNLKAAEAKGDPDAVLKWAAETGQRAKAVAESPKPGDEEEAEAWKGRVKYAGDVKKYSEYALYAMALKTPDPQKRLALAASLRERNPESEYLIQMGEIEFNAYRQLNDPANALATAERMVAANQMSEDVLIFLADNYMQAKKEPDKVIEYSNKVVEIMTAKEKPAGVSDEDWATKKGTLLGLANFMAGTTYFNQKQLKEADGSLRAALPFVDANEQLKAATLFYLGLANYQLKNYKDSLNFNAECSKIKSPFQAKARENLRVMKQQGLR